ncbi:receptor-like protein EIX1 isoform X2 [Dioscorea cayenensis subsp. rotundata]|uniref:Receptor-like protein EIX1 isoform X2 n=1 Tax=Dioscorea cayennensis subsp. rotundata TaxID=55577 RepID=A0AB40C483_DIOCR|nr:receptor-like protein EIX1 isoform X2 [Dioscorea cayenensis subsp. rotundata]
MLPLFLVSLLISLAITINGKSCIDTERQALLSIKSGIQLSNNQSWLYAWTGHDCCNWPGVACNNVTSHVIKLDLRQYPNDFFYYYDMPPSKLDSSLSQLHHLKHLDLSSNNFNNSPIPDFIGSLSNLEYLNLSSAGFSGVIPHEALGNLSNLHVLDINYYISEDSFLSTDNLHWLSGMTRLQHLDLTNVDLSMVSDWLHHINMLPSVLVLKLSNAYLQAGGMHDATLLHHLNFTSLRVLDLSDNSLNTTLPDWLFQLRGLIHLDLSYCDLYGNLPVSIGNLSKLRTLLLDTNHFGVIPESLGNLTELVSFGLSANMITKLPDSIGRLHKLEKFVLSGNQLKGRISQGIWELTNLQLLDLSLNMLEGEIPEAFGNLKLLQYFDADGNKLSGKLPETIGNLVHLQFLDLSKNAISGKLPESLGNLGQLQTMKMPSNGITGPLPESTGKLSSLRELDLSQNNITGTLPKGMGNLCKLQSLNLDNNSISGDINDLVDGLSKCRENKQNGSESGSKDGLSTLSFGNNKLNGTISTSIELALLFRLG